MRCVVVSRGYLLLEVFDKWETGLFLLCRGNVDSNLQALAEDRWPEKGDPMVERVRLCQLLQVPHSRLVAALMLVRHSAHSSHLVEQAHGAGATIMRQHRTYGLASLAAKQLLYQMLPLVNPTAQDISCII